MTTETPVLRVIKSTVLSYQKVLFLLLRAKLETMQIKNNNNNKKKNRNNKILERSVPRRIKKKKRSAEIFHPWQKNKLAQHVELEIVARTLAHIHLPPN